MDNVKIWIILAQFINFSILFFVLKHFLADKIVAAILERREKIQKIEDSESEIKEKLATAQKEADELLSEARTKANGIENDAAAFAKRNSEKIAQKAKMEADSLLGNARDTIEKEKLAMLENLKSKVVNLSLQLNAKLFNKEAVNKDFMEKELEALK